MALGMIGDAAREAVYELVEALEDDNTGVRRAAARALAYIGADPYLVAPAITALLEDEDERVRETALSSLLLLDRSPTSVTIDASLAD